MPDKTRDLYDRLRSEGARRKREGMHELANLLHEAANFIEASPAAKLVGAEGPVTRAGREAAGELKEHAGEEREPYFRDHTGIVWRLVERKDLDAIEAHFDELEAWLKQGIDGGQGAKRELDGKLEELDLYLGMIREAGNQHALDIGMLRSEDDALSARIAALEERAAQGFLGPIEAFKPNFKPKVAIGLTRQNTPSMLRHIAVTSEGPLTRGEKEWLEAAALMLEDSSNG